MISSDFRDFKNILIVKPSSMGDVVRCVPILHGLRGRYPQSRISWLIHPQFADLLKAVGELDEIIEFDRKRYGKIVRNPGATREFIGFVRELRQRRFDLVVDLQGLFRSGFLSFCTGARVRLGFGRAREMASVFYTHRIRIPSVCEHVVESYWRFGEALDFPKSSMQWQLPIDQSAGQRAREQLARQGVESSGKYFVMLAGGSKPAKRWSLKKFALLAEQLHKCYDMTTILLGAGACEKALAEEIVRTVRTVRTAGLEIVNLVDRTSLQEMMEIIRGARLAVGNDSGPLHIAAALAVPVVGLYGPTDPVVVGPYGQMDGVVMAGSSGRRRRRYSRQSEHRIDNITVKQVLETVEKKMKLSEMRQAKEPRATDSRGL